MTRERKIYGALLCLGLAALGADKLWFTPADATAQSASNLLVTRPQHPAVIAHINPVVAPRSNGPSKDEPLVGLGALAERMHAMAEVERLDLADAKDVFRPPVEWVGNLAATPQADHSTVVAGPDPVASFRERHHLIAVLKSSKGGMAILDGKSVRPGQTVDGFKLVRIEENAAVFEANGRTVDMQLPLNAQLDPQSITPAGR